MINPYGSPLEQPAQIATSRRKLSIGLPAIHSDSEHRFPLTPEGAATLLERGYRVIIEAGAADPIHYNDNAYARRGIEIADRAAALAADVVIYTAEPQRHDIDMMRRGAMLLTLMHLDRWNPSAINALLMRGIVTIALDLITDPHGNHPFADILAEIDGRAAIALASSLLADSQSGKGILLGGVAGIVPCEVTIFGSGLAAIAAARSATGLGAMVRMFDNDVYSLRSAIRDLGPQIIGSACHAKVVESALRSADVVIATGGFPSTFAIDAMMVEQMKRGVLIYDLTPRAGRLFPSLPCIDLSEARQAAGIDRRKVYVNPGNAVPRTAAMALSNSLNTLLDDVMVCEGVTNALKLTPGLRGAVLTFLGKVTNREVGRLVKCRATDITIFLQLM